MEIEGYLIDIDYVNRDNRPILELYVSSNGRKFKVLKSGFKPYFYSLVPPPPDPRIESYEKVKMYVGGEEKEIYKVYTFIPAQVKELREEYPSFEADILFTRRFLIDEDINSAQLLKIDCDDSFNVFNIEKKEGDPKFSAIAFDIEVLSNTRTPNPERDQIVSIAAYSEGETKVFTWLENDKYPKLKDEKECITRFLEYVRDKNPDILVGYNSDNFDLPFIKQRSKILGIDLPVKIEVKGKGESKEARVVGFSHIDVYLFIRNIYSKYNLKTDVLTLDEVAAEILGERKAEFDWTKSGTLTTNSEVANSLCEYNARDAYLTYKIYKELEPYIIELNKLVGLTLFDVSRMTSGMAVEYMLMRRAKTRRIVIPDKPSIQEKEERASRSFQGAFVYQPNPGIYNNVAVVDFRSLYPSIIISNNIDPFTMIKNKDKIEFSKDFKGLIPETVEEVFRLRSEAKDKLKSNPSDKKLAARVSVLKLIANSFYGYLGYANSRLYCFECGAEVARLGREYIMRTIKFAESKGFKVIYADTDSNFLTKDSPNLKQEVEQFLKEYNATLPKPMELELQDVYDRAIFVKTSKGERGARKKYALIKGDEITVKGFQSVRRDWSLLTKEIQLQVIEFILKGKVSDAIDLVKNTIKDLRNHKLPMEKLVIHTMLRKPLDEYDQSGRHVEAAIKSGIQFSVGDTIEYVIVKGSEKQKISERAVLYQIAKQKNLDYDAEYYINRQLLPAVLPIFETIGISREELLGKKSGSLLDFA